MERLGNIRYNKIMAVSKILPITQKGRSKIPITEILAMRIAGASTTEIAKKFGVTKEAIRYRLKGLVKYLDESVKHYEENRAMIFSAAEKAFLEEMLSKKKIKRAGVNQLAYAFRQVYDANRLEKGLSTQNIVYADLQKEKEAIEQAIREYEEKMRAVNAEVVQDEMGNADNTSDGSATTHLEIPENILNDGE